jgi:hypothetical protein
MNNLTGSILLTGELILCNAVKDIYFTSMMKFQKIKQLINRSRK